MANGGNYTKGLHEDPRVGWLAFDRLPPVLRDAVNDAPYCYHVGAVEAAWQAAEKGGGRARVDALAGRIRGVRPHEVAHAYGSSHPEAR